MTWQGKQVLVTGANGFVGLSLVARLAAEGACVRGLVRSEVKGAEVASLGAEPIVGDLTDSVSLKHAVEGCSVVFNVGAAMRGSADVQVAVNVDAVRLLVDVCHKAGVDRLVHVSSIATYGFDRRGVMTEGMPLRPGSDYYAQTKTLGERTLFQRGSELGLSVVVVRPGMIYGPRSGFWTGKIFRLMRRRPALLPGKGRTYCPVIYIGDLVDLMLIVATHPAADGEAFNAVSDELTTWRQYLGAYAAMAGHQIFISVPVPVLRVLAFVVQRFLGLLGRPQPVYEMVVGILVFRRAYSMNKAANLLGWRPRIKLAEGMAITEEWLRETGQLV